MAVFTSSETVSIAAETVLFPLLLEEDFRAAASSLENAAVAALGLAWGNVDCESEATRVKAAGKPVATSSFTSFFS